MQQEPKDESVAVNPKDLVVKALIDHVFSNADMSNEAKPEASYRLVVASMLNFIPHTVLQARVLKEAKALENALGPNLPKFDIVLMAKPFSNKKVDLDENTGTEQPAEQSSKSTDSEIKSTADAGN